MSGFDFGAEAQGDAYHAPLQDVAPIGNYVFKIVDVENTESSGKYPMLKLRLECAEGVQWDNMVISPNAFSVQKLLGLIDSAGLARPVPGTDIDAKTGKLSDEYAQKLFGKEVGGIVRGEVKRVKLDDDTYVDDPDGTEVPRIKGYQPPSKLSVDQIGPTPGVAKVANGAKADTEDDIPF